MSSTPTTLTDEESSKLLKELNRYDRTYRQKRANTRNNLIALLMLEAGLRVGEVVRLFQSDLTVAEEPVMALRISRGITKTRTERIIPLTPRIKSGIQAHADKWWGDYTTTNSGFAFFQSDPHIHISSRQVERIIKSAAIACLGRPIHPHVLRHTFATRLMRTCNSRIVQELLGHKHLTSTQVYTHPNQTDLTKAIQTMGGETNAQ